MYPRNTLTSYTTVHQGPLATALHTGNCDLAETSPPMLLCSSPDLGEEKSGEEYKRAVFIKAEGPRQRWGALRNGLKDLETAGGLFV